MAYSITIEVPTAATDSNRILGQNKFVKHKIFKSVKEQISLLTLNNRPEAPLAKFDLTITRYGAKCLDYDNLVASFKPYIDGLKLAGIIEDDSWKYIRSIRTHQHVSKDLRLLEIKVEEVA